MKLLASGPSRYAYVMNTQTKLEVLEARTVRLERSGKRWRGLAIVLGGVAVGGVLMAQRAPEDIGERWP